MAVMSQHTATYVALRTAKLMTANKNNHVNESKDASLRVDQVMFLPVRLMSFEENL